MIYIVGEDFHLLCISVYQEQLFECTGIGLFEIGQHLGMVWVGTENIGALDFCMNGTWFAVDFNKILS